ncbi:uncharacterized protein LOC103093074 [Monodelphis domestica]|uniref:uncharacterized protein LOC103093074 n=1 Tax=Monodelphis domestica TaxID=13616 RepID=UPI0024E1E612|nr:uncharacterized protein LOC103093074 [Monodelphis domestica]
MVEGGPCFAVVLAIPSECIYFLAVCIRETPKAKNLTSAQDLGGCFAALLLCCSAAVLLLLLLLLMQLQLQPPPPPPPPPPGLHLAGQAGTNSGEWKNLPSVYAGGGSGRAGRGSDRACRGLAGREEGLFGVGKGRRIHIIRLIACEVPERQVASKVSSTPDYPTFGKSDLKLEVRESRLFRSPPPSTQFRGEHFTLWNRSGASRSDSDLIESGISAAVVKSREGRSPGLLGKNVLCSRLAGEMKRSPARILAGCPAPAPAEAGGELERRARGRKGEGLGS